MFTFKILCSFLILLDLICLFALLNLLVVFIIWTDNVEYLKSYSVSDVPEKVQMKPTQLNLLILECDVKLITKLPSLL